MSCCARGVFGGDHPDLDLLAIDHGLHGGNRLRLVIFNGDQHQPGLEDMADHLDPLGDALCLLAHQAIIATDVRFALGTIDDQDLNLFPTCGQFHIGGETGAAQTGDPGLMDTTDELQRCQALIIRQREALAPLIQAIGLDMNT